MAIQAAKQWRKRKIISIITFTCASMYSNAAIPPPQITLELATVKTVKANKTIKSEDVAKVIPLNLQPGESETDISLKIVDRSIDTASHADFFRDSELGKTANVIENSMKTDISLGGKKDDPTATHHNLNLQVQAFEQKAAMKYTGLTDLQITYKMNENAVNLELHEALTARTSLVVSHEIRNAKSQANVVWAW